MLHNRYYKTVFRLPSIQKCVWTIRIELWIYWRVEYIWCYNVNLLISDDIFKHDSIKINIFSNHLQFNLKCNRTNMTLMFSYYSSCDYRCHFNIRTPQFKVVHVNLIRVIITYRPLIFDKSAFLLFSIITKHRSKMKKSDCLLQLNGSIMANAIRHQYDFKMGFEANNYVSQFNYLFKPKKTPGCSSNTII